VAKNLSLRCKKGNVMETPSGFKNNDFSSKEIDLMHFLFERPASSDKEISAAVGFDSITAVVNVTERMKGLGLVRECASYLYELTDLGKCLIGKMTPNALVQRQLDRNFKGLRPLQRNSNGAWVNVEQKAKPHLAVVNKESGFAERSSTSVNRDSTGKSDVEKAATEKAAAEKAAAEKAAAEKAAAEKAAAEKAAAEKAAAEKAAAEKAAAEKAAAEKAAAEKAAAEKAAAEKAAAEKAAAEKAAAEKAAAEKAAAEKAAAEKAAAEKAAAEKAAAEKDAVEKAAAEKVAAEKAAAEKASGSQDRVSSLLKAALSVANEYPECLTERERKELTGVAEGKNAFSCAKQFVVRGFISIKNGKHAITPLGKAALEPLGTLGLMSQCFKTRAEYLIIERCRLENLGVSPIQAAKLLSLSGVETTKSEAAKLMKSLAKRGLVSDISVNGCYYFNAVTRAVSGHKLPRGNDTRKTILALSDNPVVKLCASGELYREEFVLGKEQRSLRDASKAILNAATLPGDESQGGLPASSDQVEMDLENKETEKPCVNEVADDHLKPVVTVDSAEDGSTDSKDDVENEIENEVGEVMAEETKNKYGAALEEVKSVAESAKRTIPAFDDVDDKKLFIKTLRESLFFEKKDGDAAKLLAAIEADYGKISKLQS